VKFFELDRKGVTRIVILIGKFAIKIPNFTYSHLHFLNGCYANWSERHFCKRKINSIKHLAIPSYFCSWFGLIQIQARAEPKLCHLTKQEIKDYEGVHNGDYKKENFGYYEGKLVCLDYP
jgi:hypothetical protein